MVYLYSHHDKIIHILYTFRNDERPLGEINCTYSGKNAG